MDESLVYAADLIAALAHKGQCDKQGNPYIEHPRHVASKFHSVKYKATALLHDVIEDTSVTEADLRPIFGDEITDALVLLTHDPGVPYLAYIEALKSNKLARAVKIEDLRHNSDTERWKDEIPEHFVRKIRECYIPALKILEQKEDV